MERSSKSANDVDGGDTSKLLPTKGREMGAGRSGAWHLAFTTTEKQEGRQGRESVGMDNYPCGREGQSRQGQPLYDTASI